MNEVELGITNSGPRARKNIGNQGYAEHTWVSSKGLCYVGMCVVPLA